MSIDEKDMERRRAALQKDIRAREKNMRRRWRDVKSEVERRATIEHLAGQNSVAVVSGAAVVGLLIGAMLAGGRKKTTRNVVISQAAAASAKSSLPKKIFESLLDAGKDALVGYLTGVAAQKLQDYISTSGAPPKRASQDP